ncbi:oligopeptide ABC transporter permease [Bacillus sp. SM2101]|uniref:oligopeptide ABC transporter permease n=1 Tax=Bacillus sp. SM2101 TaxID=2805366 RepID=UPI001BDE0334|nr:oligopeptide ABC transporter permease [Bacillus sp. SM2101]
MEPSVSNQANSVIPQTKRPKNQSPWAIARRKFLRNKPAMISLVFLIFITTVSMLAEPLTVPMEETNIINTSQLSQEPSSEHWFGTDKAGREVFDRVLHGGKTSLLLAFSITLILTIVGTIIGATSGFFGGKVDSVLMRFTDFVLIFPFLPFVIVLKAIFIESGIAVLIFVISLLSWTGMARIVRGRVLAEKENEYILSAISIGCSPAKVIRKHLFPNIMSIIIVQATLLLAVMIVVETGLSFLGFGVPMTTPSWGNMLQEARSPDVLQYKWWIWLPPGLAIALTILSINFVGEGLKDAFNPKSSR